LGTASLKDTSNNSPRLAGGENQPQRGSGEIIRGALKDFSAFLALLLLLETGCSEGKANASQKPEPKHQQSQTIWIGNRGDFWVLLKLNDPDPEGRRFRSPIDQRFLGLPGGTTLYRIFFCNFSDSDSVQVPVEFSSRGDEIRSLPMDPPPTRQGEILWRALGGSREILTLEPQNVARLTAYGPVDGLEDGTIFLDFGESLFELRPLKVAFDEFKEFRNQPRLEFFLRAKEKI